MGGGGTQNLCLLSQAPMYTMHDPYAHWNAWVCVERHSSVCTRMLLSLTP